jgi:alanine-glyoxylate transaminase/serine-glyoxylate transaminase/serine-pyruvate transaminase
VLRAIDQPIIDHRSEELAAIARDCLEGLKSIFKTKGPVIMFPSSGTGAWEAALVNTLSKGDKVLAFEIGQFSSQWAKMARGLGLVLDLVEGDWRHGVDLEVLSTKLQRDKNHEIKAVMALQNETSTGVVSDIPGIRKALDDARHPALLLVDTISSLASIDFRHDEWGVDVTVGGSQKGLMLPPGMSFNAISDKALEASKRSDLPKSYWRWDEMLSVNPKGFFPYTPPTNMLYGLQEAIRMLNEEGLQNVFDRHARHGEATRRAVRSWGLEILAKNPQEYSNTLTAVMLPDGYNEAEFRALVLSKFNMSLGAGLGKIAGKVFRIGHLGYFNDLMLMGTLAGVEMGLTIFGVPHNRGGVNCALEYLTQQAKLQ